MGGGIAGEVERVERIAEVCATMRDVIDTATGRATDVCPHHQGSVG